MSQASLSEHPMKEKFVEQFGESIQSFENAMVGRVNVVAGLTGKNFTGQFGFQDVVNQLTEIDAPVLGRAVLETIPDPHRRASYRFDRGNGSYSLVDPKRIRETLLFFEIQSIDGVDFYTDDEKDESPIVLKKSGTRMSDVPWIAIAPMMKPKEFTPYE
jgi:hypothetical protein